jgi:hypothetical protein
MKTSASPPSGALLLLAALMPLAMAASGERHWLGTVFSCALVHCGGKWSLPRRSTGAPGGLGLADVVPCGSGFGLGHVLAAAPRCPLVRAGALIDMNLRSFARAGNGRALASACDEVRPVWHDAASSVACAEPCPALKPATRRCCCGTRAGGAPVRPRSRTRPTLPSAAPKVRGRGGAGRGGVGWGAGVL